MQKIKTGLKFGTMFLCNMLKMRPEIIILQNKKMAHLLFSLFGRTHVECFGFEKGKPGVAPLLPQVRIHDYKGTNDFVIELKTKSPLDRVILAKVAPGETLAATIASVQKRAAKVSKSESL